ncbi:NtaA/DmoA family FMN-dependent monooxygenase [Nocardioides anomalus]|uniref:NtaA/DmoA family FMN-dependent monooxygenase n=1 Tax=Nocardioides anomalus TaxID=2712223 RepID=A0A6G6WCL8_9ACTN|nr:NtaA/DmoA family FMN-dependent monooxygenase [Nocardioides anomalus]QIG42897.1 NtaA/DmoA family FMN-dependent monooxygenase [Nocardioides anomalus]
MTTTSLLPLIVNMQPSGVHAGAWLAPGADPRAFISLDYHRELATLAERGRLDGVFLADFAALQPESGRQPRWTFDPVVTLSALAAVTEHVGLVASISTTLTEPYHVARVVASLDHVSRGRAGWNVVTSFDPNSARNFGLAQLPDKDARYRRAGEFVEVVDALWSSWEQGALALDRGTRTFIDTDKVHPVDHVGEFFSVAGPLQVPPPPQGRPVVFQAGGSDAGRDLAARTADGVFAAQLTVASSREYRDDLRVRAEKAGRRADDVRLFPGVVVTVGETRAEALAKREALNELVGSPDARLAGLAHFIGVDPASLALDEPLPPAVRESAGSGGGAEGFRQSVLSFFDEPGRTVGDFLREGSLGHRTLVGDPATIVDSLEEWRDGGAADGFVLMFESLPTGLRDFVELVVPELQRRGLTRTEYDDHETFAARLGLDRRTETHA